MIWNSKFQKYLQLLLVWIFWLRLQQKKMDTRNLCLLFRSEKRLHLLDLPVWENPLLALLWHDDLEQKLSEVSSVAFGVDILVTTSTEENGYKELVSFISEGKTIEFIVSSGVGKSTLSPVMAISEEEVERYDDTLEPMGKSTFQAKTNFIL